MDEIKLRQLLGSMSLREKIGQMIQLTGSYYEKALDAEGDADTVMTGNEVEGQITPWVFQTAGSVLGTIGEEKIKNIQKAYQKAHPHGIPLLFMADVIHGCSTIFPIPLGQACSFHPELVKKCAAASAREAAAQGLRATFSPMIDVSADPRWGRIMESFGEDPYLNGTLGKAMVEGYQEEPKGDHHELAGCLKHFAGYGAVSAGREYNDVEMSQRTFFEQYLKPFREAIKANPSMVMTAFHAIDRVPISKNEDLLKKTLRDDMGFDGVLISDWGSIGQLEEQHVAADQRECAIFGQNAGIDIDMMSRAYMEHLEELVLDGSIPMEEIDESVWKILCMKNDLGLFEDPFSGMGDVEILSEETKQLAKECVMEGCVLLKNEEMLPLKDDGNKEYWGGPYTSARQFLSRGSIFGKRAHVETIESVLKKKGKQVDCITGSTILTKKEAMQWDIWGPEEETIEKQLADEEKKLVSISPEDTVVLVVGEHEIQSVEAASRAFLELPKPQKDLFDKVWARTKNIITVLVTGRPLDVRELSEKSKAFLVVWRPGTMGAEAIVDLVYGDGQPAGKLAVSFPYSVGQCPVTYWDMTTGHPMKHEKDRFSSRYMDIPNAPLFPFGFGLTYTSFTVKDIRGKVTEGKYASVTCTVKNTGQIKGTEVVQCYVRTKLADVVRPEKQLIRFRRVTLNPGEEQNIQFTIPKEEFSFYDRHMNKIVDGILFQLLVGTDSTVNDGCDIYFE